MTGQHRVKGVLNQFQTLWVGAPQGLPDRKPLWPQGAHMTPRDIERDADMQAIWREKEAVLARLAIEQARSRRWQHLTVMTGSALLGVCAVVWGPSLAARVALYKTYEWGPKKALTVGATSAQGESASVAAFKPAQVQPGSVGANSAPAPVSMDAGIQIPVPALAAPAGAIPYTPPATRPTSGFKEAPAITPPKVASKTIVQVEPIQRPTSAAPAQPVATSRQVRPPGGGAAPAAAAMPSTQAQSPSVQPPPLEVAAAKTVAPRIVEFMGNSGVFINFGDGSPVRIYRLNSEIAPGEIVSRIDASAEEVQTNRRTIKK